MVAAALVTAALLIWSLAIAVMDWRQRRVPNLLLLALLLPALAVVALTGAGLQGATWLTSLLGLVVGFAVTLPGYAFSKLGAGDVKLAAVMGFVLGWPVVAWMLLASALVLGVMAIGVLMVMGFANARTARIPAAVALSGGFAVVLLAQLGGRL